MMNMFGLAKAALVSRETGRDVELRARLAYYSETDNALCWRSNGKPVHVTPETTMDEWHLVLFPEAHTDPTPSYEIWPVDEDPQDQVIRLKASDGTLPRKNTVVDLRRFVGLVWQKKDGTKMVSGCQPYEDSTGFFIFWGMPNDFHKGVYTPLPLVGALMSKE